ncbi:SGNH/GDSL hydrolase family protein [Nocardia aurantia]|uniref:Lipase 1 n=1 Tax=Nocardia aurantia TaxID=2585199 RepID=A0A7K0DZF4_9NOCA|nr:SGNH/GDSL hydrolase family protein [Nocardia aurantia]MQY30938.1 Lipase 1 [Nocardia aurantia]
MQRRYLRYLVATIPLVAICTLVTCPAGAADSPYNAHTAYAALGDSYSAGLGGDGPTDTKCGRNANGYPTLWAQAHGITSFTNATCGGAVGQDVLNSQLSGLGRLTDVVTITVGGNDVGLGDQVSSCLQRSDQGCRDLIDEFDTALPGHMATIDKVYAAIRAAAGRAEVYVLDYPHLFEPDTPCSGPLVPSQVQRRALADAVDALDDAIEAHATRAGFHFVEVRGTFAGHGVCSATPWLHPAASLPAPLHPTTEGYRSGYFAALEAVTG